MFIVNSALYNGSWNLQTASYDNIIYTGIGTQDSSVQGIYFKSDGTVMYIAGATNDRIYQYNLSTAWDVSSATYSGISRLIDAEDRDPKGLFFSPDGAYLFMIGTEQDKVVRYAVTTAWTVTGGAVTSYVHGQDGNMSGLFFKPDGTKMYLSGDDTNTIRQYDLSTAWQISSGVTYEKLFSISSQTTQPLDLFFKPDGTKMYVVGLGILYQYVLTTAWDIGTALYETSYTLPTSMLGIYMRDDGLKFYMNSTGAVRQFSLL